MKLQYPLTALKSIKLHKFSVMLVLAVALLALQGCASYTKWKVDAVAPSQKGVALKSIAPSPFTGESRQDGTSFARLIAGHLDAQRFVEIRQQGAEGKLIGTIDWGRTERDSWRESYEYKKKTRYRYYAKIRKSLTASYNLTANGQSYAASYSADHSREKDSSDGYRDAKSQLPTEEQMKQHLMNELATRISRDLTPYRVRKTYKLKYGDTDKLELGAEYAKLGREEQAMSIFRQISERTSNDEDRAAALYNMGVIFEIRGDFDKAFEAYRNASQFHLEELMYPEAITRLEKEMKHRAVVDQQIKALSL
jgi:tetratricopeptide (TPR) repeat protein